MGPGGTQLVCVPLGHFPPSPEILMTAPTAPAQPSLMEDLIDIWYAPSAVFARRKTGMWGPLVVVAVLCSVLMIVNAGAMQGVMDAEVQRAIVKAMEKNPSMPAEQLEGMRSVIEGSIKWGAVAVIPAILFLLGLVVFLLGKLFGGTLTYGTGVMIASLAYLPRVLEMVLVMVQALVLDTSAFVGRYQFSWGVGRFLDPSGDQTMVNLLGRIDLFTIWVTVLIAIGLEHAAKVEKPKAYAAAAICWVIGALPVLFS